MRELIALSTLPAAWVHAEPRGIVESLAEVALRMLSLELVYIRVPEAYGAQLEVGRTRERPATPDRGEEIGRMLAPWLGFDGSDPPHSIPGPTGQPIYLAVLPIGHDPECGWLVTGSNRPGFPDEHEHLLLGIAANQLAVMLRQKRAEEQLREEAHALETINAIGETIASQLDIERVVQQVTNAATAISGAQFGAFFYNVLDESGEHYQLYTLSGASREDFDAFPLPRNTPLFEETFTGQGVVRSADIRKDSRYGRKAPYYGPPSGHLPVVSYLAVPVVSRNGEVIGGLFFGHSEPGVFTERSERLVVSIAAQAAVAIENARLYENLRDSADRLAEADRRKDQFLATLAHELRNPLAPLRHALKLIQLPGQPEEVVAKAHDIMGRQLDQLVRLVDDLLDVGRITLGRIELRRETHELTAILNTAVEAMRPVLEGSDHRLELELPDDPIYVQADTVRLSQVFCNLLHNASKFMERGGRVVLRVRRSAADVEVSIRDSGIGIPAETLPHVFDMFTQADTSLEKSHGGLGLGLTIVKHLVELHGGTVQARSEGLGYGSEFTVRLPVSRQSAEQTRAARRSEASPGRRILIADDNADVASSLALVLQALGNEVSTASDGLEVLDAADASPPDVILLDIGMPALNGFDACRRIRERPWGKGVTLIALSGWGQEEYKARAFTAGFDDYLVKPVDPYALDERLRSEETTG